MQQSKIDCAGNGMEQHRNRNLLHGGFSFALNIALVTPLLAQGGAFSSMPHYQFDGPLAGDELGRAVSDAGDVNGDGFDDIVVGASDSDPGGKLNAGSAYVYSGATGGLIYQFDGGSAGNSFGRHVEGAGDVNGDGFDDIIIGAPAADPKWNLSDAGSVYVFSGATGSMIYHYDGSNAFDRLGSSVAGLGDIDGDGFDDFAASAPYADPNGIYAGGSVFVYSGATGGLIYRVDGVEESYSLSVSWAGDIDNDELNDFIVSYTVPEGWGEVIVCSGATGGAFLFFSEGGGYFGLGLGAGDVDGDGFGDIICSESWANPNGLYGAGSAYVYSGASGNLIYRFDGRNASEHMGYSVAGAGDVNGDGFSDILVSNNSTNVASVFLYSGETGALLLQVDEIISGSLFGGSLSTAGDINKDGVDDFIVGAGLSDANGLSKSGSAYVYCFNPFLIPGTHAVSASSGGPLGFEIDFPDSAAFYDYKILISTSGRGLIHYGVDIPLTYDEMVLQTFFGHYPFTFSAGLQGSLDSFGNAIATIVIPPGQYASIIGITVHFAAIANQAHSLPELTSISVPITIVP